MKKALLELARSAKPRAASGSDLQRLVALESVDLRRPDEAARIAEKLQADAAVGEPTADRRLPDPARRGAAEGSVPALPPRRCPARTRRGRSWPCGILSMAPRRFAHRAATRSASRPVGGDAAIRSGAPIVPKPPDGLQVSQILPLLDDSDPAVAAEAGYLLALMGESRGLEPLLRYAQQQGKSDSPLQRLAYRAIAALDDSNQIPLLKKIYAGLSQYEVSEFYWTIRIMTGPEILKFRKQIRDEVGMNQLQ